MAESPRLICRSEDLADAGRGVRFEIEMKGRQIAAFVVRHHGRVVGYLNRCGHLPTELDWNAGDFFDSAGRDLLCATHGARYDAATGRCLGGPCDGVPLVPVRIEERDGKVYYAGRHEDG